ncbi:MAG TPA: hypothetical protein VGN26_21995 [Armatimonadota bacterium]|jgi:hypothetical protein
MRTRSKFLGAALTLAFVNGVAVWLCCRPSQAQGDSAAAYSVVALSGVTDSNQAFVVVIPSGGVKVYQYTFQPKEGGYVVRPVPIGASTHF